MMKKIVTLLLFTSFAFSCSIKPKSQSAFKLFIGALEAPVDGGAYVETFNTVTSKTILYKLDSTNSVSIPYGIYNLTIVIFAGPQPNSGEMMCGNLTNSNFDSENITVTLNISANECSLAKYATTILSLKKDIVPNWETDRWDLSHWGQ